MVALTRADSVYDVRVLIIELKELGVKGFVSKASMATDLIPAIEIVPGGGTCFGIEAANLLSGCSHCYLASARL